MTVYAVYEPPVPATDTVARADGLSFVREGFSWAALLVPLLWLIYHRMWIEFVVLLLVYIVLQLVFGGDPHGQVLIAWLSLAIGVLLGFEGNDLRAASLERRGYRVVGAASGRGRVDAERAFFTRWLAEEGRPAPIVPPRPRRQGKARPLAHGEGEEVIGLFPQA